VDDDGIELHMNKAKGYRRAVVKNNSVAPEPEGSSPRSEEPVLNGNVIWHKPFTLMREYYV
jgi:hypothetical protein